MALTGAWIVAGTVAVGTALALYLLHRTRLGDLLHMAGRHIHHLVWGILLLLLVGYGWLVEVGTGSRSSSLLMSRLMSLLYGAAAALTLDEFALWLNLRDVYWAREGRASIDAALLFGSLLLVGIWGAPLWRGLVRDLRR